MKLFFQLVLLFSTLSLVWPETWKAGMGDDNARKIGQPREDRLESSPRSFSSQEDYISQFHTRQSPLDANGDHDSFLAFSRMHARDDEESGLGRRGLGPMPKLGVLAWSCAARRRGSSPSRSRSGSPGKKGKRNVFHKRTTIVDVPMAAGAVHTTFPAGKLQWNSLGGCWALVIMTDHEALGVHIPHGAGHQEPNGEWVMDESVKSMIKRMYDSIFRMYEQSTLRTAKPRPKAFILAATGADPPSTKALEESMKHLGLETEVKTYPAASDCYFTFEIEGDGHSAPVKTLNRFPV